MEPIPVTKSFLPPIDEYSSILERSWNKKWITNRGELVLELEGILKDFLKIKNIIITNNGTVPLQIAIKALDLEGEIITTPFSYIATSSVIVWEKCKPVYVDIDPVYLTIDEKKIEEAITPRTKAILATHVFGNPCNIEAIQTIADKHGLKVIYDGAHCFGVNYNGTSVFNYGDISTCSFHATKIFHTGEGGAMFCNDESLNSKLFYSHNFGHNGPLAFHGLGINGKISELQAALGLAVFPYWDRIVSERKQVVETYNSALNFSRLQPLKLRSGTEWNYSYYPVVLETEEQLGKVMKKLADNNVFPRRYFYPSLNSVAYLNGGNMPVSERIASSVLCLPLYAGLESSAVEKISSIINSELEK